MDRALVPCSDAMNDKEARRRIGSHFKTSACGRRRKHMIQPAKDFRRVILAAAVGNVIEWYDFYIFGSLAAVLSVKFFEKSHPVAALLSTIALFTAGFLIRPLG